MIREDLGVRGRIVKGIVVQHSTVLRMFLVYILYRILGVYTVIDYAAKQPI